MQHEEQEGAVVLDEDQSPDSKGALDGAPTADPGQAPGPAEGRPSRRRAVPAPDDADFLVSLETLCRTLNLPLKWTRRQATEGLLPCLRIGPRLVFSIEAVRKRLQQRAQNHNQYGQFVY